jgi:hypothetical protein
MSSRHAEHPGEYPRLGCAATRRLLASRFASQFQAATAAGSSVASLMPGETVVGVTDRRRFYAQPVDNRVEARDVAFPHATTPQRDSTDNKGFLLPVSGSGAAARRAAEFE